MAGPWKSAGTKDFDMTMPASEYDALKAEIERLRGLSHMNAKSWDAMVAERDRLRAGLEEIIRECGALNKGPVACAIARIALRGSNEQEMPEEAAAPLPRNWTGDEP